MPALKTTDFHAKILWLGRVPLAVRARRHQPLSAPALGDDATARSRSSMRPAR